MTAVLLVLLIAQPAAGRVRALVQHLAAQLSEADRLMAKDPEEAIRLLNALLDDPKGRELEARSPTVRATASRLSTPRPIQLRQGQAQAVVDDMTALLDRKRARFLAGRRAGGDVGFPRRTPRSAPSSASPRGSPEPRGLVPGAGAAPRPTRNWDSTTRSRPTAQRRRRSCAS